jgi:hypothetical protein
LGAFLSNGATYQGNTIPNYLGQTGHVIGTMTTKSQTEDGTWRYTYFHELVTYDENDTCTYDEEFLFSTIRLVGGGSVTQGVLRLYTKP